MKSTTSFTDVSQRLLQGIHRSGETSAWSDGDFNQLALDIFALQFANVPVYQRLCKARGATPRDVRAWHEIPALPTRAFKEFELSSLPIPDRTHVFWSSGTTGPARRSQHFHGAASLQIYEASLVAWFRRHLLQGTIACQGCGIGGSADATASGSEECQLLALTPPAAQAPHSSLVHMFETIREVFALKRSAFVGLVEVGGGWGLGWDKAVEALDNAARTGCRVLLLGPAFAYVQLLDRLRETGRSFQLPAGSQAMETGGYKGRSRVLSREELHDWIEDQLGLARAQIVSEYGMCELSSQAYDHPAGIDPAGAESFAFPPWTRVQLVSPENGREVGEGQTGLVRVFDLANLYSIAAVQTEDLAVRRGNGIQLVGRAAVVEPRGCSLMFE